MSTQPTHVLFLCTGNSCRSQMAEGFLRSMGGTRFEVHSAGSKPAGYVHPMAIEAMREVGIDLSQAKSKSVADFDGTSFDFVVTVCDGAREQCPVFQGSNMVHWSFEDPAGVTGNDEQKMRVFRRVRDEIRHRLRRFIEAHG